MQESSQLFKNILHDFLLAFAFCFVVDELADIIDAEELYHFVSGGCV